MGLSMVSARIHPTLAEAQTWAEHHRELLEAAWAGFEGTSEWPQIERLQRDFERLGMDIDVGRLGFDMPGALGFVEQEALILRVRALSFVPAAADVLEAWAAAVRLAYRRYVEDDTPQLRGSDLRKVLELDEQRAAVVSALLLRESWAFGSSSEAPPGDWAREVRSGVRAARGTTDARELLAARDAVEYPASSSHLTQMPDVWPGGARESALSDTPSVIPGAPVATGADDAAHRRRVMVAYGRDGAVNRALFAWLRSVDLRPQEWSELIVATGSGSPYTGAVLDRALEIVQAVVVLFTPDDLVRLRDDLLADHDGPEEREVRGQPRPNVLYEAGLAFGRHPDQTVIVEYGRLRGLSDLFGRHAVRLELGISALQDLAARLRAAGCAVNTDGTAWLDPSAFPDAPDPSRRSLDAPGSALAAPGSELSVGPDPLTRLVDEILESALGSPAAADVVAHVAGRLRGLTGSTRGAELFDGVPGRRLPIEAIKRTLHELEQHGVLKRNRDERERGYVLGELP
jgi:hypothetical protein